MGNCSLKGIATECEKPIRILTDSGNIINFHGVKQVDQILKDYPPGYGIFRHHNLSSPLPKTESLNAGNSYFLLPLSHATKNPRNHPEITEKKRKNNEEDEKGENLGNGSDLKVLPAGGNGVWRVKLVIDTKQLEKILSEDVNTEALIERMRTAANLAATQSPRRSTAKRGWSENWKLPFPNLFSFKAKDFNSRIGCLYQT